MIGNELKVICCAPQASADFQVVYAFCVDGGPDNKGMTRRIREVLKDNPHATIVVVWCMMHLLHLVVKSVLVIMDAWTWPSMKPPKKHFVGVSTFSSTWRQTGMPTRIVKAAVRVCGHAVAERFFTNMPSRCIRTRWGSVDAVETTIK